ncbi:epoxide hydrolase family protein [Pseudonocardia sp. CA-107938]|uniref:epoxide hydrolase family protein n=1 Tax=Pseudonocardia sp. CA-107938 TaxID=3240021 RepID=UPI003D928A43
MSAPPPVPDGELADLRHRVATTRPVHLSSDVGWSRGIDLEYLRELMDHWATSYDWREHETRIRALPWVRAGRLRAVHRRAAGDAARPVVVLLHGWPDSVLRFERLLPLLDDHDVVVPALPGFPFAHPESTASTSSADMAVLVADAMSELGYDRYVVSAGDFGAHVAEHLAANEPDRVQALHLTNLAPWHAATANPAELTRPERDHLAELARWRAAEGGYLAEQTTKPHTLAAGLNDSPAGLAAWIVEKLHGWSDNDGHVESVFPRDDLLTWVSAYWLTGSIGTSFGPYIERAARPGPVTAPVVMSVFPRDMPAAPRTFAERVLPVVDVREHAAGGHFAAWERPRDYADDLRVATGMVW